MFTVLAPWTVNCLILIMILLLVTFTALSIITVMIMIEGAPLRVKSTHAHNDSCTVDTCFRLRVEREQELKRLEHSQRSRVGAVKRAQWLKDLLWTASRDRAVGNSPTLRLDERTVNTGNQRQEGGTIGKWEVQGEKSKEKKNINKKPKGENEIKWIKEVW